MSDTTKRALKRFVRIALFGAVVALVPEALKYLGTSYDPNSAYYVIGTAVLAMIDKWARGLNR